MRIAVIVIGNSRRGNYLNGHNLRYGNAGGSGTDTSSILVSEYLVSKGHEVVFVIDKLEPQLEKIYKERGDTFIPGTKINGVTYTYIGFEGVDNLEFDVLINMLWFHDYESLPIKVNKSIIYWSHMQWLYGASEVVNYAEKNNLSIGIVHISDWEKSMTNNVVTGMKNRYDNITQITIPNPVMDDMVREVLLNPPTRKSHKFVFHASWARGGNVAIEAIRQLPFEDKELHGFDYLITIPDFSDNFFTRHNSVDKKTLFNHIAESEYFVYPLYTPYQDVHKDTFSCVVAEAIALGCIVITYPLGALPENFNDYCVWLDFPPNVDSEKMQKEALSKDLDGKFIYTENIIQTINNLESNPELKEKIRLNGTNYILDKFSIDKVGEIWYDFIKQITV